jgi:hypothetical protein
MKKAIILTFLLCSCKGDKGTTGSIGIPGLNGTNAQPCTVIAASNGAEIVCPDGTSEFVNNGINGQSIVGPIGPAGPQGLPGVDLTPITWVQFCQATPSYPSTFPEGGLCINGNIYAVYSTNDGFLTLVPPGAYTSDGVGSSCNFTILANCQIQD